MRLGKREQVVVGVLAAIGVIVALHILVFRPRAMDFQSASVNFQGVKSQLESSGSARPEDEVAKFKYETINYELDFLQLLKQANVQNPPEYVAAIDPDKQKQNIWNHLQTLEDMRDRADLPELTFMGKNGWNILTELPERIRQEGRDVGDMIRDIRGKDSIIRSIGEGTPLRMRHEYEYMVELRDFDFDLNRREQMKQFLGPVAALLYTLNRVQLVRDEITKEDLGIATEKQFEETLLRLFRVEWPEDFQTVDKQLQALEDLIRRAGKHGIEEITYAELWEYVLMKFPFQDYAIEETEETEAAAEGPMAGGPEGMEGMNIEMMLMYGVKPPGMEDMDMDQILMMLMGGQMTGGPAEEEKETVGAAVPIRLRFRGSNMAVMKFVYEAAHSERFYEVDELDVRSLPNEEGLIAAQVLVKVFSHYGHPEYQEFTYSSDQIDARMVELLREREQTAAEIRQRGGDPSELPAPKIFDESEVADLITADQQ